MEFLLRDERWILIESTFSLLDIVESSLVHLMVLVDHEYILVEAKFLHRLDYVLSLDGASLAV